MEIEKNEKKYNNKCDDCGFEFETVRKYLLVQELLKHKESCKDKTSNILSQTSCTECDYKVKENYLMKRHMRDVHSVNTGSTSPMKKM